MWDKNILKLESTQLTQPGLSITHQVNKGVMAMNNRDFVDKHFKFSE